MSEQASSSSSRRGEPPSILAQGWLAAAKDARYVATAAHLIGQALEAWQSPNHPQNHRQHSNSASQTRTLDAYLLALFLYYTTISIRGKWTLGMQAVGLSFAPTTPTTGTTNRWRLGTATTAGLVLLVYLRYKRQRNSQDSHNNRRIATLTNQQTPQESGGSVSTTTRTAQQAPQQPRRLVQYLQRHVWPMISKTLTDLVTSSQTGGPHDMVVSSNNASNLAWWCLRLYAAYYCLVDRRRHERLRLPSLLTSWLWGQTPVINVQRDGKQASSRLVNTPSDQTYRVVGLLILMHTGGVLLQQASRLVLQAIAARYWTGDETISVSPPGTTDAHHSPEQQEEVDSNVPIHRCAICHEPRRDAACAVTCGHVLCWKCWHTWLNVRSACPICRAPCRPQEILPLY